MAKKMHGEGRAELSSMENEASAFAKYQESESRIQALIGEIQEIMASASDRAASEKKVLDEIAPKLDQAMAESKAALAAWVQSLRADQESLEPPAQV
jgi:hypothetical protein